jgi:hypothetical protein
MNINDIIAMSKTIEIEETIETAGVSPFRIAATINEVLAAVGYFDGSSERLPIAPQSVYGASKAGKINGVKFGNPNAKHKYTEDEATKYIATEVAKKMGTGTRKVVKSVTEADLEAANSIEEIEEVVDNQIEAEIKRTSKK